MNRRPEPDAAKVEGVTQHISSLKELVAAGLRSSELVQQMFTKLPHEHRNHCTDLSTRLSKMLNPAPGGATSAGAEASRLDSPRGSAFASFVRRGMSGSALSPPQSGRTSPAPASPSSAPSLSGPSKQTTMQLSVGSPSTPGATGSSFQPSLTSALQFRQAILGSCDAPQEVGMEKIPRPGMPGLMSGDLRPLRAFLTAHAEVLEYLHQILESTAVLDALSFANMMWVQTHPGDFEAASIDTARIAAGLKRRGGVGPSSAPPQGPSAPVTTGAGPLSSLEDQSKHLLFLNLSLRFPPSLWAELLQMRDAGLHSLKSMQQELTAATQVSGVAVMHFPSIWKTMNALDAAISGTSLLPISSRPADIQEVLFLKYSAVVVELGFVLHDHTDVLKVKKVSATLERVCGEAVELLRQALRRLGEISCEPFNHSSNA
jgi:hypothetical protein